MRHPIEFATVETLDSNSILEHQQQDSHLRQLNFPTSPNPLNSFLHRCFREEVTARFASAFVAHIPL